MSFVRTYDAGNAPRGIFRHLRALLGRGLTLLVVEHDMEFVRRLGCKVTVLHEGSVLAEGSLDHVTANQDVIDVYLGR